MDIFKYHNPTAPTKMERGEIIDGFKSKMWVERYRDPGEFSLKASLSTGIREKLPLGTFISHIDTSEIMIVENHEISENRGEDTYVTITGRGFEAFLEHRIVSSNRNFPNNLGSADYVLSPNNSWVQAVVLLEQHILAAYLIDPNDAVPFVSVANNVVLSGESVERSIPRGENLHSALMGLLKVDNVGIRVVRPERTTGLLSPGNPDVALFITAGVDRSSQIVFSYDTGEIESADYLWSDKNKKTSALVSGKWVEVRVDSLASTEFNRRMMYVDASDIDEGFDAAPTGTDLLNIRVKMEQRGIAALAAQKQKALISAQMAKEHTKAVYRQDFNVGDLIMVRGDYNETRPMRVSEFVEIEDETGQAAYPTLTVDE